MPGYPFASILFAAPQKKVMGWLLHLGGIGLIPLGVLDSSVIPIPGSMDFATILLSARDKRLWLYYALMATVGSVVGGYLTYRLARKGGKEALVKKLPKRRADKVVRTFERWGFASIFVPSLLPPPIPLVPFIIAAGALQYSRAKFAFALTAGRAIRYLILAFLGVRYGSQILSLFTRHPYTILFIALGLVIAGVIIALIARAKNRSNPEPS
jgi:membrane protein YqaA with SNARE-associated domain